MRFRKKVELASKDPLGVSARSRAQLGPHQGGKKRRFSDGKWAQSDLTDDLPVVTRRLRTADAPSLVVPEVAVPAHRAVDDWSRQVLRPHGYEGMGGDGHTSTPRPQLTQRPSRSGKSWSHSGSAAISAGTIS